MLIDLKSVFNTEGLSVDINADVDFSDIDISGEFPFKSPAKVIGRIYNRSGIVRIDASSSLIYSGPCDRCACDIKKEINIPIEHVLVTELSDEENDELILLEGYEFNLDNFVREDVLLNLPLKFLCKDDCKGLCPICGKNLNEGKCGCKKEVDPRLEALKQLLDN